jgi:histidyl-tRNA synthetase
LQQTGLTKCAFKVGHIGVLKGLLSQEKVDGKVQNAVLQLMDKKQHSEAIALLEKSGTPQKCISIIRRLVELRGANTLEIVDSIKNLVDGYEQSVEAARNLGEILTLVSRSGCKIDITVEAGFARGLEYYTGMIFETYAPDLDIALGGGGRYNRLIQLFGGEPAPAVGVAHGIDRIMLGLQMQKTQEESNERKAVTVVPTKDELVSEAFRIAQSLRQAGISAELEVMGRKMVKALEVADKKNTAFAVIVGDNELKENSTIVRDLAKREQQIVSIEKIGDYLKNHI